MRDALSCVFVLRGAGRKIDCGNGCDDRSGDVGLGEDGGNGEEAMGEDCCGVGDCGMERCGSEASGCVSDCCCWSGSAEACLDLETFLVFFFFFVFRFLRTDGSIPVPSW